MILSFQAQISDTTGVTISTNRGEAVGKHQATDVIFAPSDEANVYVSPLNLVKSVSSTQARAGDTLVYTLAYANRSDSNTATNAVLRDVVPIQHVTFQSASHGGTYNPGSGTVNWTLGTLAPGANGSVTFTVRVNDFTRDGTVIENVGYINSAQTAEAGSNEVRTTVLAPKVKFTKSGPTAAAQGQAITYTLSYNNVGGTRATGVTIQDTIPISTSYEAESLAINTGSGWVTLTDADDGDQGAYISPTLTIAPGATAGTIAAGEAGQIRFSVRIDDVSPGSFVQNWATLSRDLGTPRESNLVVTHISDLATIHGTVFEDTDGDGTQDANEPGIHQVLVTLDDVITTTTDLDGGYTFSTTVPGVHAVVETDPTYSPTVLDESPVEPGYMPYAFKPGSGIAGKLDLPGYFSTTPNEVHVDVTLGQSHRVDFGDMLTDSGFASIYGTVYNDADGDGVRDADEPGIPGVLVTLDGAITTTTDIHGCYTFSTAVAGTHTVVETDRAGYFSTTPNEAHVDVMLGHGHQVEFGDAPISSDFASIYGTVFEDLDRDGAWDADELGIADVLITMDWIITTTTDLNGGYTFATTMAGTHTLRETDPEDHVSTTSNTVNQDVR
nr:DUF11 domain-containing protein [Anaerolineae bacterium]